MSPEVEIVAVSFFVSSLLGAFVAVLFLVYFSEARYKKGRIMTQAEHRFFRVLTHAVGDYTVLAQVRLASIVYIPNNLFSWKRFGNLGAKCVDFVLIDPQTGETQLVVELDDASHRLADRMRRDRFVNGVLKTAGIPIVHIRARGHYDIKKIQASIFQKIPRHSQEPF